ncbi:hypothetical protein DYB32_004507 [Aphanomyces invadans]|uniref:Uncharacterized protein n=1 Tax=Aphanomyces invadans TaxID=157072 RepID=A0A3R6ZQY7_9STRA|nr:hypothetical protein DYB32_004507 [Aphanomyces invadans]
MVGYFLPLLLTESPEQRRATLVTTQTVLLQREHTIRQKFNALKADVAAFEAAVGDIWKVAALRKLRDDHMLRESDEHVDVIKKAMVERRADMESLLVDTTRSIRDAISMLRDRTVCPSTEHPSQLDNLGKVPNRIVTVDSPDADPPSGDTTTTSATTDVSSSAHAKAAHPQVTIIAPSTPSREKQTATPSSPSQRPPTSRPKAESSPSRPPREFPITFLQAAMVFFAALPTATPSRPDRSHVPPKHTLNHNTKLGLACLAKLKPIFSKHAHKAKDQAVKTTAQQLHLPIHEPEHVQRMLRTRDVKLASLTTPNHEWVAILKTLAKYTSEEAKTEKYANKVPPTKLLDTFESLANEIAIHPHLLSVNLTNNEIGDVGGQLLGATLAAATCTIQDLNLSWNQICHAGATAIGHALQTNRSVQHLNLSMNRFGDDGGHQVAAALLVNTTLRTVDMTRNNLTGSTAVSLSYAIEHNPKAALYNLVLVDNPLGCTGTKALLRSVARGSRCSVRLSFYGGEDTNNAAVARVFDSSFPAAQSPYELHLHTSPYEYVIACQLVAAAVAQRCDLFDVTFEPAAEGDYHEHHVRKNATTTKPANINVQQLEYCDQAHGLVEKGSTKQFDLRHRGILRISARYIPWRIQTTDDVTPDGLRNVIKIIKDRISTREMTLHCIVDGTQTLPFLLRHLSFSDQNRLMSSHGVQVLQFNPVNPTGKWTLDLSDRIHRKLAVWFSMINRDEATESMRRLAFRGNTSQRGTFANFRNEKLNGKAFELTDRFFDGLPNKGVLEFDYVSTRRPEDVDAGVPTSVLGEVQVNALLQTIGAELWSDYVPQHKRYDLKRQVVLLQHALSGQYIMAEHVRMLMQYFPKNIDNLRLKVLVMTLVEMVSNDPLDLIKLDDQSIKEGLSIYSMYSPSSIPTTGRLGFRYITRANKTPRELVESRQSTFSAFLFAGRLCGMKVQKEIDDDKGRAA